MIYDLVIIGMGPAGVTAAIYAKRAGLNVLCMEKAMIGGYVNYIDRIENYPGMMISGPDLAFKFYEHIKELGIDVINKEVKEVIDGDVKKIVTSDSEYLCKNVLIATGFAQPNPNIKNARKPFGSICAIGLRVNLPCSFGVGSPHFTAAIEWANSCKVIPIISAIKNVKNIITLPLKSRF